MYCAEYLQLILVYGYVDFLLLFCALQISSLLGPLLQLVKTGFTKAVQRLDGVYALLIAAKIASADIKAGFCNNYFCNYFGFYCH